MELLGQEINTSLILLNISRSPPAKGHTTVHLLKKVCDFLFSLSLTISAADRTTELLNV